MSFLVWHYRKGLLVFFDRWRYDLGWVIHYFSLPLLIKYLFSPWKRVVLKEKVGLSLKKFLNQLSFNLTSRIIGAIVRLTLFFIGFFVLSLVLLGGIIVFPIWLLLPFLSLPFYSKEQKGPHKQVKILLSKISQNPSSATTILWQSKIGKFCLQHCSLATQKAITNLKVNPKINEPIKPDNFFGRLSLPEWDKFLKNKGLNLKDLQTAFSWWFLQHKKENQRSPGNYGRPGIGLELLFGYTPELNKHSLDLAQPQDFSDHLIGREEAVSKIERVLTSNKSVFVVGPPGVGKHTVILEFAKRAAEGQFGREMAYRRVLELNYQTLLSASKDLNQKKEILNQIFQEAAQAGNVILVLREIHRLTNSQVEGFDFTDILTNQLKKGKLKIIATIASGDFERFIAPDLKLRQAFESVKIVPPTQSQAMQILMLSASNWEKKENVIITTPALRRILETCDRYILDVPFPEKALELLDEVVVEQRKQEKKTVTKNEVDLVLSQKTGISLATLTQSQEQKLTSLEKVVHQTLINQEEAVSLIAKSLRSRSLGIKDDQKPVGAFLFLGPTGVGKTETAKALARVYFGSEKSILRFDMAEYASSEGITRLIGSRTDNQSGELTTAIKNNPANLLLLDEIEKAPKQIINLFLSLLDEGRLTDARGKKINCQHLFVIATSNAGAEKIRQLVNQKVSPIILQKEILDHVQKKGLFQAEFLNRFDGVVVYQPLSQPDLVKIARLQLKKLQTKLKLKNMELIIDEPLCQRVAEDGYQPEYGARPMKRVVDLILGDLISQAILKKEIVSGDKFKIIPLDKNKEYRIQKP